MLRMAEKILAALAVIIFVLGSSAEAAKKTVAVMPLENVSGYTQANVAQIMAEELTVAIQNSGRYSVIERSQMGTILKEQGFQSLTSSDPVEVGKLSGANYSVIGKVTMATVVNNPNRSLLGGTGLEGFVNAVKGKVAVDIRFVNNETGEIVFAKSFEGSESGGNIDASLHNACKEAAENFLKELNANFSGRVADISGEEIYIDQGAESGLRKGDTLLIVRETEPIIIGEKIVGMKTIQIGKAKVTEVNAEYSVCKISKVEKGISIKKGDVVKRG